MTSHPTEIAPATTWKKRLTGVATGAFLALIGWWLVSHGAFYSVDMRYLQPTYTASLIAMGVLVTLVSLVPARIITKMAAVRKYKPYRAGPWACQPSIDQSG